MQLFDVSLILVWFLPFGVVVGGVRFVSKLGGNNVGAAGFRLFF